MMDFEGVIYTSGATPFPTVGFAAHKRASLLGDEILLSCRLETSRSHSICNLSRCAAQNRTSLERNATPPLKIRSLQAPRGHHAYLMSRADLYSM
jgi:hypothetical protein